MVPAFSFLDPRRFSAQSILVVRLSLAIRNYSSPRVPAELLNNSLTPIDVPPIRVSNIFPFFLTSISILDDGLQALIMNRPN